MCFYVWCYSVCESHPLTAGAELSLIQLCLLSCLLAAPASWLSSGSAMASPSCLLAHLLPLFGSQSLLFPRHLCSFLPPWLHSHCPCPRASTCPFSSLFFAVSVIYSFSKPLGVLSSHSASCGAGVGDLETGLIVKDFRSGGKTETEIALHRGAEVALG